MRSAINVKSNNRFVIDQHVVAQSSSTIFLR